MNPHLPEPGEREAPAWEESRDPHKQNQLVWGTRWKPGCNSSHIGYYVLSIGFRHREIGLATEAQTAFFSYSRDDSEFALRLAEDLKAAGANVWLDQLDIAPGQRWARAVQDALTDCQRLLVILSPSSVSSTNVEDEVAFALEEHKTVIPVFYRDCKVPFQLRPFQYVDFRIDYDRGLKTLLKTLGVEQQAAAAGGATVSAVPKDTAAHVSGAGERKRAAGQQQKEQEEKQAAEQARLEEQERERLATEEKERQQKLEQERQAAAEQARLQEERRPAAEDAQREEPEHQRKAAEEQARPFLSKKMIIGLAVGVIVPLLLWILWPRGSDKQASQPQTAAPQPPTADVNKPLAKNCPEGVYCDPDTSLMWTIQDNGEDISWRDAGQYCKSLTLAGLSGWELPTIDELGKLYHPKNSRFYIRKPLRLTGYWVWSSTNEGLGSAWVLNLDRGERAVFLIGHEVRPRAFCVRRSGK